MDGIVFYGLIRWWRQVSGQEAFEREMRDRTDLIFDMAHLAAETAGQSDPNFSTQEPVTMLDPLGQMSRANQMQALLIMWRKRTNRG